jgi:transcriptional regulator with XRE-family HTH domain
VRRDERLGWVAANVRRVRLRVGWTQEELAEQAGLATVTIQVIERGRANLTLSVLFMLADALDVSCAALLRPAKATSRPVGRPKRVR